jgi:uncharacterized protein (DUF169 family)
MKEASNMASWSNVESELKDRLWLRTHPIGYKRFEDPEDLDRVPGLTRLRHYHPVCQLIAQSRKLGLTVGDKNTGPCYYHCARIHGLQALPPGLEKPEHGLKWCGSWEDESRRLKAFPRIPPGGGIVFAPLASIPFDPDVILIYGDPAQVIILIQAIQKKKFERFQFACIGESSCADSLADCYLTGKPKLGLPGYGERMLGHVREDELVLALPPPYLVTALEGLEELGIRYPIPHSISIDMDMKPDLHQRYPDDPAFFP